jgi:transposase
MKQNNIHREGAAAWAAAGTLVKQPPLATIKLGVDVHQSRTVVAMQHDHATPKPAIGMRPEEFVPWVERLLARGHRVFAVYEACGFGFGLQRELTRLGATCYVVAPCKLDEQRTGVKTDHRDATALCQRLSRFVDGNRKELALVRVPTEQEERDRSLHRQREGLVRARTKMQAQGRALLVNHSHAAPALWWRKAAWSVLERHLPEWLTAMLAVWRPLLTLLDTQIATLGKTLEAAAPAALPVGLGKLTNTVVTREVCDWARFQNRQQVSSYTGLCPGEPSEARQTAVGSPKGD